MCNKWVSIAQTNNRTYRTQKICFLFCHYTYIEFSLCVYRFIYFVLMCRMCWNLFKMGIRGKRIGGISSSNNIEEDKKGGHTQQCNGNYFQFLTTSHCTNISNRRNMFALSCIICIVFQKISHIHKFSWSLQKVLQLLWYTNVVSCCIK